jgi:hypothetical protein
MRISYDYLNTSLRNRGTAHLEAFPWLVLYGRDTHEQHVVDHSHGWPKCY